MQEAPPAFVLNREASYQNIMNETLGTVDPGK
jgi:hypothetical protein